MRARCPTSTYIGLGILRDWTWIISARGYANITPSPPAQSPSAASPSAPTDPTKLVYGLIYTLTAADEDLLDGYEGVPLDYTKEILPVEVFVGEGSDVGGDADRVKQVLAYVDRLRIEKGIIRDEYVLRMQRACREAREKGVPWEWMEKVMGEYFPLE